MLDSSFGGKMFETKRNLISVSGIIMKIEAVIGKGKEELEKNHIYPPLVGGLQRRGLVSTPFAEWPDQEGNRRSVKMKSKQ